jgi:hypothetical protein
MGILIDIFMFALALLVEDLLKGIIPDRALRLFSSE